MNRRVLALFCLLTAVGCSNLDFDRSPVRRISDTMDTGQPFVDDRSEEIRQERAERFEDVLEEWERTDRGPDDYSIGVNDVLEVSVLSLDQPGRYSRLIRAVGEDGRVVLPLIGKVEVEGLTVTKLAARIESAYRGRIIKDPQVTVLVKTFRSKAVIVTGAVTHPGVHYLNRNRSSVLEVLFLAGGLARGAGDDLVIIRGSGDAADAPPSEDSAHTADPPPDAGRLEERGKNALPPAVEDQRRVTVDLSRLIDAGDARLNLPVFSGDVLAVAPRAREFAYVLGYVRAPGRIELNEDADLTALNALAIAGGPTGQARVENSYLIRETDEGNRIVEVDLLKIAHGVRPDFSIQAGDTLVVGSGLLMKALEFLRIGGSATYNMAPGTP
jgi:polysaccharide export outer membrane protein